MGKRAKGLEPSTASLEGCEHNNVTPETARLTIGDTPADELALRAEDIKNIWGRLDEILEYADALSQ